MNGPQFYKMWFPGYENKKVNSSESILYYTNKFCRKMIQQMLQLRIFIFFPILYTFINTLTKNNIQTLRKLNNFGSRAHSLLLAYKWQFWAVGTKNNQHS